MTNMIVPGPRPRPPLLLVAKAAAIGATVGGLIGALLTGSTTGTVELAIVGAIAVAFVLRFPTVVHATGRRRDGS